MEQEIERLNNSKTQSMIKENSEICRMIDNVEKTIKNKLLILSQFR